MRFFVVRRSGTWSVRTKHANCACGSRKMCFGALRVSLGLWGLCLPAVPSFMPDTMLEDKLVAVTMCSGSAFPMNYGPGDLEGNQASADVPAVINLDCILEQALVEFQSKSVQVAKDFRSSSGRTNFAVAAAISAAAAVMAAGRPNRRARGGRKWRQPTTLSTTS